MSKKYILAKEGYIFVGEGMLHELCDNDHAYEGEMAAYDLINALVDDIRELEQTVIETRKEGNRLSTDGIVYYIPSQDICNRMHCYHPAVKKYIELYGDEAMRFGMNCIPGRSLIGRGPIHPIRTV